MKYLIVGAGFSGAVIARELAEAGHNVRVIEKRNHVAGNAYDYTNEHGIRVHEYGPHLFHTNNKEVYDYLGKFTEWVPYHHKVKALLEDGRYATLPVNRETKAMVGEENVLDIFFRPYTKKMWGMELDELNPEIINRVPIRDDDNDLYFPNDAYQAMPKDGYTAMVQSMLAHANIQVMLETSYDKEDNWMYDRVFNSMPIDQYFDFKHGNLPYRSIRFETVTVPIPRALPSATLNFTHDGPQTRVTEWKNIPCHGDNKYSTTLTFETPCDYADNNFERYYPVKDADGVNRALYQKYKNEQPGNVTFIGRCGLYAYLDMHQAVNSALATVRKFLS
jgi:UDP-galactopyranose mutase|tara:strand:+ start:1491 stop:2492 length:1002 start_codon:yes stop_codon:yes gene_type:complete